MTDKPNAGQRPDQQSPENQTDESEGPIKKVQRDGHSKRGQETNRGSEPATGAASRNRG